MAGAAANREDEADHGPGPFISANELAAMLGISRATVYRFAASPDPRKHWPSHRIGGQIRFSRQDVEQIIAKGRDQRADNADEMTTVTGWGAPTRSKARRTRRW